MSVFKDTVFSAFVFLTGTSPPAPDILGGGGFDEYTYKRYRDYLEKLTNVQAKQEITKSEIKDIAKIAKKADVKTPELAKIATYSEPEVNYDLIAADITRIKSVIAEKLEQIVAIQKRRKDQEETALLLLLS